MHGFPHDASYKVLLAHKELMADLGLGYLHEDLTGDIDWDSLELVSPEYVTGDLRRYANDLVWRLRRRGTDPEGEEWIYVFAMLEFQSTPDPYMAVRVMTYMGALYQDFIAHARPAQDEKLPVLYLLVIYNGRRKRNGGCEFRIERFGTLDRAVQVMEELLEKFAARGYERVDRSFAEWLTVFTRNRYPKRRVPKFTSVKEVRMQVHDDSIPWGEQQVERQAREAAARAAEKGLEEGRAKGLHEGRAKGLEEGRAEAFEEAFAEVLQEVLPILRRSLANRARGRFGERVARLLSSKIELLEDPAAFDRICSGLDTCESGESLLALVQAGQKRQPGS